MHGINPPNVTMARDFDFKAAARWLVALAAPASASAQATAVDFTTAPCSIVSAVAIAIEAAVPAIVTIMFTYGAIRYVFSAEDPGGRKNAKDICISAIIAGILFAIIAALVTLLSGIMPFWVICPGM